MNLKRITGNAITGIGLIGALSGPVFSQEKNLEENKIVSKKKDFNDEQKIDSILNGIKVNYKLSPEEMIELRVLIKSQINRISEESITAGRFYEGAIFVIISTVIFSFISRRTLKKYYRRKNLEKYTRKEVQIMEILFENAKMDSNPVVIYKGAEPLYWNPAMEKLTGYTFEEILEKFEDGEDIMKLLYGYSEKEINKVKNALGSGKSYENAVFTLQAKDKKKHQVAWHTEMCNSFTIRRGSENVYKVLSSLEQSHSALTDSITDLMEYKDSYTSGHINRVMAISEKIGEKLLYDEFLNGQLRIKAILHDYGKRQVPDNILKKPGLLNDAERIEINSHTGNGVFKALKKDWEEYTDGMAHHCYFYSSYGKDFLTFEGLLQECKNGIKLDPLDFNRLMGHNIPEAGRIISIGDVIDAISSRRVYSDKAGLSVDELIDYLNKDLLSSTGLLNNNGTIILDSKIWIEASNQTEKELPYCIVFDGKHYIPEKNSRIQFDPILLIKIYENGVISKELQDIIAENDKGIIKEKVGEFVDTIEKLEIKKRYYENQLAQGNTVDESLVFTPKEDEDLQRIKRVLLDVINIKQSYGFE